jgi:hypothetical protein
MEPPSVPPHPLSSRSLYVGYGLYTHNMPITKSAQKSFHWL